MQVTHRIRIFAGFFFSDYHTKKMNYSAPRRQDGDKIFLLLFLEVR